MLTTQGRGAELPDNLAGFSVDNDNRRDRPKAHNDVAVRQFGQAIAIRPGVAAAPGSL